MTQLFKRDLQLIAGPLTIEPRTATGEDQALLKVRFDIVRTDHQSPNEGTISIWNLNQDSRSKLQEKGLEVVLKAGYVDEVNQIFKGDIETSSTAKDNVNWVTTLEVGDGSQQLKKARTNKSFRGKQSLGQMLKQAADDLGLDPGNLQEKIAEGGVSVLKEIVSGVILSGKTSNVLNDVASKMGYTFSVQDKALQFVAKGEVLQGPAVKLSASTGLIGSPQVGEKGVLNVRSLLNGRIIPRKKIELESVAVSGEYVAKKVQHIGDTWGADWVTAVEMVPL